MLTLQQNKNVMRQMGVGIGMGGPPIDVFPLEPPVTPFTTPPYDGYDDDYEDEEEEDSLKWDSALTY